MTDEFGFEIGESNVLEELLNRLERQELGSYEFTPSQQEGVVVCPGELHETVSRFSRYHAALPAAERNKLTKIAGQIIDSFKAGCQKISVRIVGHADRDLVKERQQPGFLMSISRQRASSTRHALEQLINDRAISSHIDWDIAGVGASSLIVPDPENKPENLRALNRRVEIFVVTGAAPPEPVPSPTTTKEFKIVIKSFINTILPRIGATRCLLFDPANEVKLGALAAATQAATNEAPPTDVKDKIYRMFSSRTFTVTCANGSLASVIPSQIDTDVGIECIPRTSLCLTPPPLGITDVSAGPSGPSSFDFAWTVKGRPHPMAEPGFQVVCPRSSMFIWHTVRGQFVCTPAGITVTTQLAGSHFPSHRLWVNGVARGSIPQGSFSQLWVPSTTDKTLVA